MIEIKLKEKESGYDVVGEYIERYWKHHGHDDTIVSVAISYDGESYDYLNEVCYPDSGICTVIFLNDWWEGQKYIRLFGITNVNELDISSGIYYENGNTFEAIDSEVSVRADCKYFALRENRSITDSVDRCKDCAYLVELNSEWYCDNYQMLCSDIKYCKEVEDE